MRPALLLLWRQGHECVETNVLQRSYITSQLNVKRSQQPEVQHDQLHTISTFQPV